MVNPTFTSKEFAMNKALIVCLVFCALGALLVTETEGEPLFVVPLTTEQVLLEDEENDLKIR